MTWRCGNNIHGDVVTTWRCGNCVETWKSRLACQHANQVLVMKPAEICMSHVTYVHITPLHLIGAEYATCHLHITPSHLRGAEYMYMYIWSLSQDNRLQNLYSNPSAYLWSRFPLSLQSVPLFLDNIPSISGFYSHYFLEYIPCISGVYPLSISGAYPIYLLSLLPLSLMYIPAISVFCPLYLWSLFPLFLVSILWSLPLSLKSIHSISEVYSL